MGALRAASLGILCTGLALSQQYVISTVAGGAPVPTPVAATTAPLAAISGVAADNVGNVYFTSANCVFKLDQSGILTRVAGTSRAGYSGDGGPAANAQLNGPDGIAADGSGNLYIADTENYRVRKVSPAGIITTVAGNGSVGTPEDGAVATNAMLGVINGLAVDGSGDIFISDPLNSRVLEVSTGGIITTVAGNGTYGFSGDGGPAKSAQLAGLNGVAVDTSGNIFIADTNNNCVRKVTSTGMISTVAGTGSAGFSGDGELATSAELSGPQGLALDGSGNLYIADQGNNRIRRLSPGGLISTVAGNGVFGFSGDGGSATSAQISGANAVAVDSSGSIVIDGFGVKVIPVTFEPVGGPGFIPADFDSIIRKILPGGLIVTVAGSPAGVSSNGLLAANAQLSSPTGVATDGAGDVFISDFFDSLVLKISASGIISTVAGTGTSGFSGDGGPAASAQLAGPGRLAVDGEGTLYIADEGNSRVRKVSTTGIITTAAGNGTEGYSGDNGPAAAAQLGIPYDLAVDGSGNLYIVDLVNSVVRKVSTTGIITTVAGNGSDGFSGDGGPAVNAQLAEPEGVAVDGSGNLFIADTDNSRVRKVSTGGIITTVAGTGIAGVTGDGGQATSAQLEFPNNVAVDGSGNVYIGEGTEGGRVRRVSTGGIISTIAGDGAEGFSGDGGLATSAEFGTDGITIDGSGNIYIVDYYNDAIRKLTPTNQTILISAVLDAASESAVPVSPGKVIVIYGGGLGPSAGVTASPPNGAFGTTLAGTTVSVNGVAAPVFYTSATQVNAIVPYEVSGTTANITIAYQGGISTAFSVPVAASSPGFFSYNATGAGQAAAINDVDGTLNTAANPVKIGAYISFYATGEGQTTPAGVDGKLATLPLPSPNLPVSVTVGGIPAFVQYKGGVYGAVAGLMQVNVQIPAGVVPGGYVPVVLKVGNASTVDGALWIAVSN